MGPEDVKTVGVVGAGQMGAGIAQVSALAGLEVVLYDVAKEFVDRGVSSIEVSLSKAVEKGKSEPKSAAEARARIHPTLHFDDFARCQLVIEAVTENADVKKDVFRRLDKLLAPDAILASNTSSISITELAAATSRPDRFIGMHFFNPVPIMKLVEIVRGHETSASTFELARALSVRLGKEPCVAIDFPGFISNRILMPMINEAVFALHEGVGDAASIDKVMKLGMNHPMGPLELADFIGLDTCLSIMEVLEQGFGDSKYRPCPLLRKMVRAGHLGRKTGRGFYVYKS